MQRIISIIQIFVSLFLILAILVQNKGVGLSGVFGGEGNVYRTKRGAERVLYVLTIVLGIALAGLSLARVII